MRQSVNAETLWSKWRGRQGDGDKGGRAHSRPEVLQCYCSGVTMREERVWVIHKPLPLPFSISLPSSLTPQPPLPSCLQCPCSQVTSILTHSFTTEPTFVIQMKSCYLRGHCSSHYSSLTYFTALAAGAPFIKMLQSLNMCRERRTHTHPQSLIRSCCIAEWVADQCVSLLEFGV